MEEGKYSYKNLLVWHKSVDLVVSVYKLTDDFPRSEIYGLVSQMRGCTVSIPSNIAEGKRRMSDNEFFRFIKIAYVSGGELETQIIISKKLGFGSKDKYFVVDDLLLEVMKMLNKIISNQRLG